MTGPLRRRTAQRAGKSLRPVAAAIVRPSRRVVPGIPGEG